MSEKTACIILNYNDAKQIKLLIDTIKSYEAIDEIIVVDNHSTDDSFNVLQTIKNKNIHLCQTDYNGGYGYGNNYGVRYAYEICKCSYALIVNPDVVFDNELVKKLKKVIENDARIGVVSALQLNWQGKEIYKTAWRFPSKFEYMLSLIFILRKMSEKFYIPLESLHSESLYCVDCVAGSLLLVQTKAFLACDGYDENVFLYCEETILGFKMKEKGYKTYICSDTSYFHLHGATINKSITSVLKRRKIQMKSHRYVLKKYMKANIFYRLFDFILGEIALVETFFKSVFNK